jgi:diadenosine tetraphosphate (Ap4A) HIT family hydrolase
MNPANCPFCAPEIRERILAERGTVFAVHDRFPVTEGHLLILPERHTPDQPGLFIRLRRETGKCASNQAKRRELPCRRTCSTSKRKERARLEMARN